MVETHIPALAGDQDPLIQSLLQYPPSTPHLNRFGLVIQDPPSNPGRGRGVYATTPIAADTLIEVSPVLLFPPEEYSRYGSKTQLGGYTFVWKRTSSNGAAIMALALGLGSLFNHDGASPNVKWTLDYATHSIGYTTVREVREGEELTISYGSGRMWWEPELTEEQKRVQEEEERRTGDPVEEALQMGRIGLSDDEDEPEDDSPQLKQRGEKGVRNDIEHHPKPGPSRSFPPIYRLTSAIDPVTLPLATRDAWIIDIPSTSASLAVKFLLKQASVLQNRDDGLHSTRHLRSFRTTPARTQFLLCLHSAFPDREQLVTWLTETAGGIFGDHPQPYVGKVPGIAAPTKERLAEWQAVWPCIVRTNPKELQPGSGAGPVLLVDRKRDEQVWTEDRARLRWALNRFKRVVALARYAASQQGGKSKAIPLAVHVTHSFDSARRFVPCNDTVMSWTDRESCDWSQLTGTRAPLVGRIQPPPTSSAAAKEDHIDGQKSRILSTLDMTEGQWSAFNNGEDEKPTQAVYVSKGSTVGTIEVDAIDQRVLRRNPLKHAAIEAVARVSVLRTLDRSTAPASAASPPTHASPPNPSAPEAAKSRSGAGKPLPASATPATPTASNSSDYLLTSLSLFTLYEPCVYCTMALLHSRVREIFFLLPSPGRGACCGSQLPPSARCEGGQDGGVYALQEQKGLNHSFSVWRWMAGMLELQEVGEKVDDLAVEFDIGRLDP
ncbi:uncharacterized protein SPSC_02025 [Sporisorium scitamineum]|uniref:SET domain-containing protein n=1 Tax=Sporisorium scitamineum TaxID=49012 RepID=A0A127ZBG0_9BASI|nr:uncharacterized protein SPSC_02025 [Sporisorium scitamineum]